MEKKLPENMLVIQTKKISHYKSSIGLTLDLVISNTKDILNDNFGNPCVYDLEDVIEPESGNEIKLNTRICIPLDTE